MDKLNKNVLQVAKEVVIKFIEVGRVSPTNFSENFETIYNAVLKTVGNENSPQEEE